VSLVPNRGNPSGDPHAPFLLARSEQPCDPRLLGVVSAPESGASGGKITESYLPLAVYGYFPVRVTVENGPIRRGDPITSSSLPGYGMRSTGACRIVGYALEDAERAGEIQMFARLGDHPGEGVATLEARVRMLEARLFALERRSARDPDAQTLDRRAAVVPGRDSLPYIGEPDR
jgi:hypothetical protein